MGAAWYVRRADSWKPEIGRTDRHQRSPFYFFTFLLLLFRYVDLIVCQNVKSSENSRNLDLRGQEGWEGAVGDPFAFDNLPLWLVL